MGLCTSKSQAESTAAADKPVAKQQETKTEAVQTEEPKTAEEPKAAEEKTAEQPKAEEPKAEEPKVAEEPKAEEPKAEEPKAEEPKTEEPKTEEPKTEEPKAEEPKTEVVVVAPAVVDVQPYTNRPEDLEPFAKATGTFVPKVWTVGEIPELNAPLTGEMVTDGKVSFDKAALSYEGVFPTRDEEVAQLQKAIDLKKDAAAETGKANALHEEHNKLFEAGDKDGAKAKLAESKIHREKAKAIHEESFNLAYAGAMSMAIKAVYSKYPSIDYHVFLVDPYEKSYLVAIEIFQKYHKFARPDFLVIPGEGQHSGASGPAIRPHFEKWMADNNIGNEKITSGSYAITLADVKF